MKDLHRGGYPTISAGLPVRGQTRRYNPLTARAARAGTTTATVLTRAIFSEGCKSVAAGMNPMDLRRGITLAVDKVLDYLKKHAKMISTTEEIAQVSPQPRLSSPHTPATAMCFTLVETRIWGRVSCCLGCRSASSGKQAWRGKRPGLRSPLTAWYRTAQVGTISATS